MVTMLDRSRRIVSLAVMVVLASWTNTAHGQGGGTVYAQNGQSVNLQNFGFAPSQTSKINGVAHAQVVAPVVKTASTDKIAGQSGDTGLATNSGGTPNTTTANARTMWQTSQAIVGPGIAVGTSGSYASVTAGSAAGWSGSTIVDPAIYNNAGGLKFGLAYDLLGGSFGLQALGAGQSAWIETEAGSNITGLENFFTLSLSLDGANPSKLAVSFISNPLLGLDDLAIDSLISSNLSYTPSSGSYMLASNVEFASFTVTVPTDQYQASFSWDTTAQAAAVPEPSALVLLGIGAIGALGYAWRRRKQVA